MGTDPDTLWDFSDPPGSEARFREAIAGCDSEVRAAVLRTQLARAIGLQRCFEEGHAELDAIEHPSASPELAVRAELERGRLLNSAGEKGAASEWFRSALERASEAGLDALAVDAAHMLGISESGEEGAAWTERAIAIAEASAEPKARKWRASLLNNLGWSRFEAGRHAEALDCFEGALRARIEQGTPDQIRIAEWCIARALRTLGRIDEALAIQTRLEQEYAEAVEPSGYVFEELGECLLLRGDRQSAASRFALALPLLEADPWLAEHETERIERIRRLSEGCG